MMLYRLLMAFTFTMTLASTTCASDLITCDLMEYLDASRERPSGFAPFIVHLAVNRNAFDTKTLERLISSEEVFNPLDVPSKNLSDLENRTFRAGLQMEINKGRVSMSDLRARLEPVLKESQNRVTNRNQSHQETAYIFGLFHKGTFIERKSVAHELTSLEDAPHILFDYHDKLVHIRNWPSGETFPLFSPHDRLMPFVNLSTFTTSKGKAFVISERMEGIWVYDAQTGKEIFKTTYQNIYEKVNTSHLKGVSVQQTYIFENEKGEPSLLLSRKFQRKQADIFDQSVRKPSVELIEGIVVDILPQGDYQAQSMTHVISAHGRSESVTTTKAGLLLMQRITDTEVDILNLIDGKEQTYFLKGFPNFRSGQTKSGTYKLLATPEGGLFFAAYHLGTIYIADLKNGITKSFVASGIESLGRTELHQSPNGEIMVATYNQLVGPKVPFTINVINFTQNRIESKEINTRTLLAPRFINLEGGTSVFTILARGSTEQQLVVFDESLQHQMFTMEAYPYFGTRLTADGRLEALFEIKGKLLNYQIYGPAEAKP